MKRSSFRGYGLNQAQRQTLTIPKFKGVDLTSQKFLVEDGKAIDISNYIYKDGKVQKRNGIEQIYQITPFKYLRQPFDNITADDYLTEYTNETNVNGIWTFIAEDKQQYIVAHIGRLLYKVYFELDTGEIFFDPIYQLIDQSTYKKRCYQYENFKSQAFVGANKLWFFGGNKYMVIRGLEGQLTVKPVEESELVQIPTTTISITYDNAIASGRSGYDNVNLLTQWRKNMLISGIEKDTEISENEEYSYTLDSPIIPKNEEDMFDFKINIEFLSRDNAIENIKLGAVYIDDNFVEDEYYPKPAQEFMNKWYLVRDEIYPKWWGVPNVPALPPDLKGQPIIIKKNGTSVINFGEYEGATKNAIITILEQNHYICGRLENINDKEKNGRVILFDDYKSIIDGYNNITVKFPCYVEGNADKINKCKFGILFGSNNAKNRLFVSGNDDYCNCDWHSSEISTATTDMSLDGNYTYFEDLSYCFYGGTSNKIVGYGIVSNDKLMVLKDYSPNETTIYFREPTMVQAIDGAGNQQIGLNNQPLYKESFKLIQGNNAVAGISPETITNLNGDLLFISNNNQLVGLDLVGIVGDNQRIANSRSYYIDGYLKNQDLTKSRLWTNNQDLYLILENDLFMTNYETLSNGQYDWYKEDISDVSDIIEIKGTKYLFKNNGRVYKYTNKYEDENKIYLDDGSGLVEITNNKIYFENELLKDLDLSKNHYFKINPLISNENAVYGYLGQINNNNAETIFESVIEYNALELVNSKPLLNELLDANKPLYIVMIIGNSNGYSTKTPYYFRKYTNDDTILDRDLYKVYDVNGNEMNVTAPNFIHKLGFKIDEECEMYDINKDESSFKIMYRDYEVDLTTYNNTAVNLLITGEIITKNNVEAYYITKPYLSNSLNYFKTIWSWTLTNDTNLVSELDVTYTNNKIPYMESKTLMEISKASLGIDFNNLSFMKLDFEKNIIPRVYTNQRILSNVKFICFGFRNLNNTNSILSTMSMTYTVAYPSY